MFVIPTSPELFRVDIVLQLSRSFPVLVLFVLEWEEREENMSIFLRDCLQRWLSLFVITTGLNFCQRAQCVSGGGLNRPQLLRYQTRAALSGLLDSKNLQRFCLIPWLTPTGGLMLMLFSPEAKLCPLLLVHD